MTITLTREEAQQVLDALTWCYDVTDWPANGSTPQDKAIEILRARLAQPEIEAECRKNCKALCAGNGDTGGDWPCARLAQPEPPCKTGSQCIGGKCSQCVVDDPEPVAWILMNGYLVRHENIHRFDTHDAVPLYTSPPQRPWVGLTDEEIAVTSVDCAVKTPSDIYFASIIEAKLREKNT